MMIRPYAPARIDRYARLCPPTRTTINRTALCELGRSTAANIASVPRALRTSPPPAAYTSFGQFIDHDLSFDETKLADAGRCEPGETLNSSGGMLDLHHLYGDGPGSAVHGYLYAPDRASFLLGEATLPNGEPFDIPLKPTGVRAPHPDNNENIILRQVHAVFLKLHNCAVAELRGDGSAEAQFARAQERVRWQYQWLVRHDFLPRITTRAVYDSVTAGSAGWLIDWETDGFSIPVEFSQAAFRFGHSMVRHEYRLNLSTPPVTLDAMFSRDARRAPLSLNHAVDWELFTIGNRQAVLERAMAIDTHVVRPLHELPTAYARAGTLQAHTTALPPELPVRTLLRGAATRLPSGEAVAAAFGRPPLVCLVYPPAAANPWRKLTELNLHGQTPLWFWI